MVQAFERMTLGIFLALASGCEPCTSQRTQNFLAPTSEFLPCLSSIDDELWKQKLNKPFLPSFFGHSVSSQQC